MKKRVLILAAAVISVLSASSGVYLITTCGKGVGATVDRSLFETEEEWYQYKVAYNEIYCGEGSGPAIETYSALPADNPIE